MHAFFAKLRIYWWSLLVVVVTGAVAPQVLAAAQPTGVVGVVDVNRVPEVEQAVGRAFDSYERSQTAGIGHMEFVVLVFTDAGAAQAALPDVFPAIASVVRQDAQSAEPQDLGDDALAWTATGPADLSVAMLIVQDDAYIHVSVAVSESDSPLDTLAEIAMGTVGRSPAGTPAATPIAGQAATPEAPAGRPLTFGGLWNLLPRYDDLPGPFVLYAEESWPDEPIPGVPPVANPADCMVEARPRPEFESLVPASPPASSPPSATPVTFATPVGDDRADAATVEGVTATARKVVACIALGEWPRAYALYTDRFFQEQLALLGPQIVDFIFSEQSLTVADGPRLVEVRNVQVLPDGRIGAVVEIVTVTAREPSPETSFMWFVREGDRFLIDGIAPFEPPDETMPDDD